MCKAPDMPRVVAPTRYAAMKTPNRAATEGAGTRASDKIRAPQSTILTSPMGAMTEAQTGAKTLLGA